MPLSANVCGTIGGALGISTTWPQVWRVWVRRQHAGLSLPANVLCGIYTVAWLLYGIASRSTVQIATNSLALVGATAILTGHVHREQFALRRWLPHLAAGLALTGVAFATGRTVIGILASATTVVGVFPQAVSLAKLRRAGIFDARGVSRARWLLSACCNALWVAYGVIAADLVVSVTSLVIATLGVLIVLLTIAPRVAQTSQASVEPLEELAA